MDLKKHIDKRPYDEFGKRDGSFKYIHVTDVKEIIKTVKAEAYEKGREDCWNTVNALIVPGDLDGNGCDKNAQRNGLILAANAIFDLKKS